MGHGEGDREATPAARTAEVRGPRTWVVLAGTAVAALVVVGVVFGFLAWRDGDDEQAAVATTVPGSPAPTTEPDGGRRQDQLFRRTTDAGIEVRARITAMPGGDAGWAPVPVPEGGEPPDGRPAWCNILGDISGWAIGPDAVVQGGGPWTEAVPDGLYPAPMWDGRPDADSLFGVVLQVGDDIAAVRLTGPDGTVDEMEPVEGAVVLAVPVSADAGFNPFDGPMGGALERSGISIVARRVDGTSFRPTSDGFVDGHPAWNDPRCVGGMVEPPVVETIVEEAALLPEPGEQPPDPAAARAEIEVTFSSLYGGERDPDDRRLIDDPYGLGEVRDQVARNGFGDEASEATVTIEELVFPTPTDAAFVYTLRTSAADFGPQVGRARLLDGVWKITRGTLCQDLAKAGAQCPP